MAGAARNPEEFRYLMRHLFPLYAAYDVPRYVRDALVGLSEEERMRLEREGAGETPAAALPASNLPSGTPEELVDALYDKQDGRYGTDVPVRPGIPPALPSRGDGLPWPENLEGGTTTGNAPSMRAGIEATRSEPSEFARGKRAIPGAMPGFYFGDQVKSDEDAAASLGRMKEQGQEWSEREARSGGHVPLVPTDPTYKYVPQSPGEQAQELLSQERLTPEDVEAVRGLTTLADIESKEPYYAAGGSRGGGATKIVSDENGQWLVTTHADGTFTKQLIGEAKENSGTSPFTAEAKLIANTEKNHPGSKEITYEDILEAQKLTLKRNPNYFDPNAVTSDEESEKPTVPRSQKGQAVRKFIGL